MNIVYAASECTPFVKSGGLGDVIGSLPKEFLSEDINVTVFLPKYLDIPDEYIKELEYIDNINVPLAWRNQYCGIFKYNYNNIDYYFIDNEYYFRRAGFYGYFDDGERFAFFSKAILEVINYLNLKVDILHCHDWQTSLVPVFLKGIYWNNKDFYNIKTIFTIHNIKFQGWFSKEFLSDVIGLGDSYLREDSLEYHGDINLMKGGIIFSDYVSTVSKTYCEEIKTPYYGEGLDGILEKYSYKTVGIVNGINQEEYSPTNGKDIFKEYTKDDIKGKKLNKKNLQKNLGLKVDKKIPIISIISRLTDQKGLDLLRHVLEELLIEDIQLVILGSGDYEYEEYFKYINEKYSSKVFLRLGFDNALAKQIYAGSDIFLMPSKFEPCGLGQLIAMKYGTIPIVRETGGLKDTVQNIDKKSLTGNGYLFRNYNAHEMLYRIKDAISDFRNKLFWNNIIKNAMSVDSSWKESAKKYEEIYRKIMN